MTPNPTGRADDGVRMKLRWKRQSPAVFLGHSGALDIALVQRPAVHNRSERWVWRVWIDIKDVCPDRGKTPTAAASRRAAERAWGKWLAHAGLMAAPVQPASG